MKIANKVLLQKYFRRENDIISSKSALKKFSFIKISGKYNNV